MTVTGLDATLERALDLSGVFIFALSGASLAARRRFDVIGILALAIATGLGGGILRDSLLGELPPAALRDQRYLVMPVVAALIVVGAHRTVERMSRPVGVSDAGGLGLFCVVGSARALDHGLDVFPAVLLGVMTAVGGGVIRDVLAREVPSVFRSDNALYAIPATLGAAATALAWSHDALGAIEATAIAIAVVVMRLLAMRFDWRGTSGRNAD